VPLRRRTGEEPEKEQRTGGVAGGSSGPVAGPIGYYYPTVLITGAAVMVIELLGARILAPYYGTSLFVWSSLITVTLVALAVGYWLGGHVADRNPNPKALYVIIAFAGIAVALVAPLRDPVLRGTDALGVRGGSLTAAFLLFTTPLVLLGMVSPYAVRLATRELGKLARTAGRLYSISTFGSFIGTIGAGFFLIPTFTVRTILVVVSVALLLVSLIFALFLRRSWSGVAASVVLLVAAVLTPGLHEATAAGNIRLVDKRPSFYGEIKVVDYGPLRFLLIDGGTQSAIDTRNGIGAVAYPYMIDLLAYRFRPGGSSALIIGLGAGLVQRGFEGWGVRCDVVEIDPKIVETAEDYFGFDASAGGVHIGDGRRYLEETGQRYDYIVLDAFAGEMVPVHLLSEEAFAAAEGAMTPGGLLLLNYVGYREGPNSRVAASIQETLDAVFDHVETYEAGEEGDYGGNIFVASDSPLDEAAVLAGGPLPFTVHEAIAATATVVRPSNLEREDAIVFTDDHNPVDLWDVPGRERWRRDTMTFFPSWVLLD
jgi:spermidine synthase